MGALSVITGNLYCFCCVHDFPSAFFSDDCFLGGRPVGMRADRGEEEPRLAALARGRPAAPGEEGPMQLAWWVGGDTVQAL